MKQGIFISSQDRCRSLPIKDLPLFENYFIPIDDADIIVNIGDAVKEGQAIVRDDGLNVLIHSPISGIVYDIQTHYGKNFLIIKSDQVISSQTYQLQDPFKMDSFSLIELVRKLGIIGLGGVGTPTHIKWQDSINKVRTVIVNAVECEPFLSSDYRILVEKTREIFQAAQIVRHILGAQKIVIAIRQNKELKSLLEQFIFDNTISILECPNLYPSGYERFLVRQVTGIELKFDESMSDAACIVHNISTLYAVYEALFYHKPLIERIITVDGAFCLEFGNFRIKVGTPISQFMRPFSEIGTYVMINGSPMMGTSLDHELSVSKTTRGILIFESSTHKVIQEDCIQCASCVSACPMRLEPFRLFDMITHQEFDQAQSQGLYECINCNICSYVCPSFIPLGSQIFTLKQTLLNQNK